MANTNTQTTTTPPAAAGKKKRIPLPYELLAAETIKSLKARIGELPEGQVVYLQVKTPPGVRKDKPIRRDFERGVLAELEAGNHVKLYNNRVLRVAQLGEEFQFSAKVKEETIRKVTVTRV